MPRPRLVRVSVQFGVERRDHSTILSILHAVRVWSEDHRASEFEQFVEQVLRNGKGTVRGIGICSSPCGGIENYRIRLLADRLRARHDLLDLRPSDDSELLERNINTVVVVAINACLPSHIDPIEHRGDRVETCRLVTITMQEL